MRIAAILWLLVAEYLVTACGKHTPTSTPQAANNPIASPGAQTNLQPNIYTDIQVGLKIEGDQKLPLDEEQVL
jgi:hypothetical protein